MLKPALYYSFATIRMARHSFSAVAGMLDRWGADLRQRVVDRVHHRRDRAQRAGFADALDAERVVGRSGSDSASSKAQKSSARGMQ